MRRVFGFDMSFLRRSRDKSTSPRLLVIGLDCAAPELVFDRWKSDLPNLRRLAERGLWGELQSSIPAITVPAWSSMLTGKDPGELGIYGFRNRADHGYEKQVIATSRYVREPRVWDMLSEAGKQSVVVGVPQTYPVNPLNGYMISDMLTPGTHSEFAYPPSLKDEVLEIVPDYDFDVPQFRTDDKDRLVKQIWDMTEKRFKVVDHLLKEKPWDFFMFVEIGVDRIQHGFWSFHDPSHMRYVAGNPYERTIHDYYMRIDQKIGEWIDHLDGETAVLVVSDHGAKRMDGGICLNEWLWREGLLVFEEPPPAGELVPLEKTQVDWSRTRAWGSGGYYGRVFLNVQGREPQGVIPQSDYEAFRRDLAEKLRGIKDPGGNDLGTRVFLPQELYREVNGVAPDLITYFGDLFWRSVGTLGHGAIHTFQNDTGPDECNHAQNGMFILYHPSLQEGGSQVKNAQLMDVTPTVLEMFGLPIPAKVQGQSLMGRVSEPEAR